MNSSELQPTGILTDAAPERSRTRSIILIPGVCGVKLDERVVLTIKPRAGRKDRTLLSIYTYSNVPILRRNDILSGRVKDVTGHDPENVILFQTAFYAGNSFRQVKVGGYELTYVRRDGTGYIIGIESDSPLQTSTVQDRPGIGFQLL